MPVAHVCCLVGRGQGPMSLESGAGSDPGAGPPSVASGSLLSLCCQVLKKLKMADPKGWPLWPRVDELLLFLTVVGGCLFLSPRGPISKQAAGLCWAREQ